MYRKSRYDKGEGDDYLNIPLDRETYLQLRRRPARAAQARAQGLRARRRGRRRAVLRGLPADRGAGRARRGHAALRPAQAGRACATRAPAARPYAVVQLRKENADGSALNLVGFQTRLTWPAQKEAFGKLPGLAQRRVAAPGRDAPQHVPRRAAPARRRLAAARPTRASASPARSPAPKATSKPPPAARSPASPRRASVPGLPPVAVPADTALGAVVAHLQNTASPDFQPANVTWTFFSPLERNDPDKRERRAQLAAARAGRDRRVRRRRRTARARAR